MPKFLESDLRAEAAKKGLTGKAADRYVYGSLNNMGAMRGSKETPKGAEMEQQHEADMSASAGRRTAVKNMLASSKEG